MAGRLSTQRAPDKGCAPLRKPSSWIRCVQCCRRCRQTTTSACDGFIHPLIHSMLCHCHCDNSLRLSSHMMYTYVTHCFVRTESLTAAPDGSLYLLDRYGTVHHATPVGPKATPVLHRAPVAFVGGGRPLGSQFDADGNLVFCHPPVVGASNASMPACRQRLFSPVHMFCCVYCNNHAKQSRTSGIGFDLDRVTHSLLSTVRL